VARRAAHAAGEDVVIATGPTRDDQVETVVMRLLRAAGARGLAALYAPARGVARPLLDVPGSEVAAYAAARRLAHVDDPSNASRAHLRNRVRHELLPALRGVWPEVDDALLRLAREAADCRADTDALAAALAARCPPSTWDEGRSRSTGVAALAELADWTPEALAAVWPALAARGGVRLDRRGTARVAAFTSRSAAALRDGRSPRGTAVVAGGACVAVERRGAAGLPEWAMVVRPAGGERADEGEPAGPVPVGRRARFGGWRLRVLARAPAPAEFEAGRVTWLAGDCCYVVRGWRPGDRWRPAGAAARRVKRFLADRRVPASLRAGWPVVVAAARGATDGEIVWVPGVRRSSAAPARPGQPGFYLHCERTPERPRASAR
jgi:tRNA(Ile)-lysidine synthase